MAAVVFGLKKMFNLIKKLTKAVSIQAKIKASFLLKLTNRILGNIGLELLTTNHSNKLKKESDTIINFYLEKNKLIARKTKTLEPGVSAVIFSFDRAIQLHALLASLKEKASESFPIFVIYRASTSDHLESYQELKSQMASNNIKFVLQRDKGDFFHLLIDILESIKTEKMFFLVDDILPTENIDIEELKKIDSQEYVLSLRLGTNLSYAYTINKQQPLPKLKDNDNKIYWNWNEAEYDWNYPLSVDGHVFLTLEILAMIKNISFHSPNTLEGELQIFKPIFEKRQGLAYKKSKIVNIPCNKVQTDINNRHGQLSTDELLKKWQTGYQIDYQKLFGLNNNSCHQEVDLSFIPRKR